MAKNKRKIWSYIGIATGLLAVFIVGMILGYYAGNKYANGYEFVPFDSKEAEKYLEPAPLEFTEDEAMDFCGKRTSVPGFLLYASYSAPMFTDEYGNDIWYADTMPDSTITVEEGFIQFTADTVIYVQTCEAMYDMFKEDGLITVSDEEVEKAVNAIAEETLAIINSNGLADEVSDVLSYDTVYAYELSLYKAEAAYDLFEEQQINVSEWVTALINDTDNPFTYLRSMNWNALRKIKFVDAIMQADT